MNKMAWTGLMSMVVLATAAVIPLAPASAETVMQQCGQQYQAAKAAGTLNGMTWNQFRSDCSAKLKAQPTAMPAAPSSAPLPAPAANPLKPTPAVVAPAPVTATVAAPATTMPATTAAGKPVSTGRAAFVVRERQCGTEWKANKVSLKSQTPGLTWPKYLSQCNTRLKAAGQ